MLYLISIYFLILKQDLLCLFIIYVHLFYLLFIISFYLLSVTKKPGSNPPAGGLLKDCGAHFPAGPGPRSPGVERGKQRGRPERSRRPPAVLPRPKRGAFGPGQRGPQGPRAPRAATAGPGADGRRKRERRGRRRDRAPEGPGSRSSGGRRGRPQAGVRWRPPQAGPTRPPEEGGSGRLSGRTSLKAEED